MSVFDSLKNKIFGHKKATPAPTAPSPAAAPAAAATPAAPAVPAAPAAISAVDVEAVLEDLAAHNPQKLDWRHSIVDLMTMLDMDSSLANRRELAKELGYTGSTSDTATMNIWLHKQVMRKMAENGGIVPASLVD
jgi:3-oxoacyl-ACP reductase-like protein